MLNKRQNKLILILTQMQDWIKNKELAVLLGVSDRTVRSDIATINQSQKEPLIESDSQRGYKILADVAAVKMGSVQDNIPQDAHGRCRYIIQRLLFSPEEINLTQLQDQIYVSGYSLDNDIRRIRKLLEPYGNLKLVRNLEHISLQGDEVYKRKFYKDLLVEEVRENFLNLNRLASLYTEFDLIELKDLFMETVEEYNYSINEAMLPMLILHVGTSIQRIMNYNYVEIKEKEEILTETIEYEIAKKFYEKVENRLNISIVEGEVRQFTMNIMGRRATTGERDSINFKGKWINIKDLVNGILENIHELFGVDFRSDQDLLMGLKMHVYGIIDRQMKQVIIEDVLEEDIKCKYPMVFEMGVNASQYIGKTLGLEIAHSETGFIALHLGAASERMNVSRKYRAIIITPYNPSFSKRCVSKISEMFNERMEVIKTCQIFEEDEILKLEPDLILTAYPLQHKLDIMTVPISIFVNTETEVSILKALNRLDKDRFKLEFVYQISSLVRPEFYFNDLECRSWEETITFLSNKLVEGGIVDANFKEEVLKREELSPTSFVNALAIPHAFGTRAKQSTIAVAHLKNPISWGSFEVRLVMLIAIDGSDQRMIKIFFDWIASIVNDNKKLANICESGDYEAFLERIIG